MKFFLLQQDSDDEDIEQDLEAQIEELLDSKRIVKTVSAAEVGIVTGANYASNASGDQVGSRFWIRHKNWVKYGYMDWVFFSSLREPLLVSMTCWNVPVVRPPRLR